MIIQEQVICDTCSSETRYLWKDVDIKCDISLQAAIDELVNLDATGIYQAIRIEADFPGGLSITHFEVKRVSRPEYRYLDLEDLEAENAKSEELRGLRKPKLKSTRAEIARKAISGQAGITDPTEDGNG